MRLLCDEMLGRLARWLRLLGLDVAYVQHVHDDELLRVAAAEDRLLLTRDEALAARAGGRAVLVRALEPEEQLREVVRSLALAPDPAAIMSRCSLCNALLVAATRDQAAPHVPASVAAAHERYWRCPACDRYYWRGTHAVRIEAVLRDLAGERGP
ncbi:MAG TPA: Mut7-C RNAse domain-containing protein [Candidatus Thermoplasmatota archaeon]|jgi:hypothetical protein|nr:Mut7-C RNAse domain-containing protein [Candidatus Thermoplasmatota archaeon]